MTDDLEKVIKDTVSQGGLGIYNVILKPDFYPGFVGAPISPEKTGTYYFVSAFEMHTAHPIVRSFAGYITAKSQIEDDEFVLAVLPYVFVRVPYNTVESCTKLCDLPFKQ